MRANKPNVKDLAAEDDFTEAASGISNAADAARRLRDMPRLYDGYPLAFLTAAEGGRTSVLDALGRAHWGRERQTPGTNAHAHNREPMGGKGSVGYLKYTTNKNLMRLTTALTATQAPATSSTHAVRVIQLGQTR